MHFFWDLWPLEHLFLNFKSLHVKRGSLTVECTNLWIDNGKCRIWDMLITRSVYVLLWRSHYLLYDSSQLFNQHDIKTLNQDTHSNLWWFLAAAKELEDKCTKKLPRNTRNISERHDISFELPLVDLKTKCYTSTSSRDESWRMKQGKIHIWRRLDATELRIWVC